MSVKTSRTINLTISILFLLTVCATTLGQAEELTQDTTWSGTYIIEDRIIVPAGTG